MSRKKGRLSEAVVGFFMIVVVALLAYFTIVISGVDVLTGHEKVAMTVVFDQVGGLKQHDHVMYRGTKVGVVKRVEVTPTNLVVHADVDGNVILRRTCRITVCNLSVLGGNYLQLDEGTGEPYDIGETVFAGDAPSDWIRDVSEVARNLREISGMGAVKGIVTNIEMVSEKANAFADKADRVAIAAEEFMRQANYVADKASKVVTRIEGGEGTVGRLLSSDSSVYDDLKATLSEAHEAMVDARAVVHKLNRDDSVENLHAGIAAFRKAAESLDAQETIARANTLMDNLNAVAEKIRKGEGTLGKLAADATVYTEIEGLVRDCRQIIDNYRDTTPIATFSSLAAGAL